MLVLSRKIGDRITIGNATVIIKRIAGNRVTIAIDAPDEVRIVRVDAKPANDRKAGDSCTN